MVKLSFKFNKEKDLRNIWETCQKNKFHDFSKRMPPKVVKICREDKFVRSKKKIEEYYKEVYSSKMVPFFIKCLGEVWSSVEKKYFQRMKKITGKDFRIKEAKVYLTLASRCPYYYDLKNKKKNWFMVDLFSSLPDSLYTIGHELMHFHFYDHYWKKIRKEIGQEKAWDLKEALTVLLNHGFGDLWFVLDKGYLLHNALRRFILKEWKKKEDFDFLINNCVKYLKKKK